ncbi:uncharacterized protein LOC130295322 isoform X2 [Hyla sarda]|uniref:uncharacterized protein LOC130295322 isoform X2 n=1 Tax=Hyla sarda TaxID=327740 RepID=UPI0024C3AC52|nr:uncharacterized protein LOC130295322 isoform X2 [Hyla sarda]
MNIPQSFYRFIIRKGGDPTWSCRCHIIIHFYGSAKDNPVLYSETFIMGSVNDTKNEDFILIGLSSDPKTKIALFVFFSLVYMTSITGNAQWDPAEKQQQRRQKLRPCS